MMDPVYHVNNTHISHTYTNTTRTHTSAVWI